MRVLLLVLSLCVSNFAVANWKVDNEKSELHFISVKKNSIGEIHTFKSLSGMLSKQGNVKFAIDLTSVVTGIEIRDQRMKSYLFEVDRFSTATFNGRVDAGVLSKMAEGTVEKLALKGTISLHGQQQMVELAVNVVKLANGHLQVNNLKPLIIQAEQFALTQGVMKLQELANLPSISPIVPVNFSLYLTQE